MDCEFPEKGGLPSNAYSKGDSQNFVFILDELRQSLGEEGLITCAIGCSEQHLKHHSFLEMSKYVDWFNLVGYDLHGSWSLVTDHQASLYPVHPNETNNSYSIINNLKNEGPSQKKLLGVPLCSKAWHGVSSDNNGFRQKAKESIKNSIEFRNLKTFIQEDNSFKVYTHKDSKRKWLYSPSFNNGTFISVEDKETMKERLKVIEEEKLMGIMFWVISQDIRDPKSNEAIIPYVHQNLNP
ncbi:MAG: glycosyl hydrolase family 18 protein [Lentisphaerales bacterium]|nr:glycosyl hydrolase family 18 protein [Lentisphaerales bacterium]